MSKTKIAANVKRYATGRILGTTALALAAVLISGANVKASTLIVTPTDFPLSGWSTDTTKGSGPTNGVAQFSSVQPQSGNGSFELSMPADPDKATLLHLGGDGLTLGTLIGGGNDLGFQYFRDSTSTAGAKVAPAFRLYFGDGKPQLVWEAVYNGVTDTNPVKTDQWLTPDIKDGFFWKYDSTGNHDVSGGFQKLSYWSTDTPTAGNIVGYSVGVGSGWGGSYKGYVDNVTFGTTTTNFENVAAAPEPSQWAGLGFTAFGALGLILKARKKKSAVSAS